MEIIEYKGKVNLDPEEYEDKAFQQHIKDGWVTGYLVGDNYIVGKVEDVSEEYFYPEFWIPVTPDTVKAFTTLKDKKEKKIYDSDLLKDTRSKITFKVIWNLNIPGWWCISEDNKIEVPLANINRHCIRLENVSEDQG